MPLFPKRVNIPDIGLTLPQLPADLHELESWIIDREKNTPFLKPANEAEIVWAEGKACKQTEVCVLYLHGFSASKADGEPIHRNIANRYGWHLYLPRLQAHGLECTEPLLDFTAQGFVTSALEALAISFLLGKRTLIISSSTGSTLALYLAAHFPQKIHTLICYSPNIDLYAKSARFLSYPFGLTFARLIFRSKYRKTVQTPDSIKYWNTYYRLEALVQLKLLLETTMHPQTFKQIRQAVFVGYYYRNEAAQDKTVSVSAIIQMFNQLGTSPDKKQLVNFPDAGVHCISSKYENKNWMAVQRASFDFLEKVSNIHSA